MPSDRLMAQEEKLCISWSFMSHHEVPTRPERDLCILSFGTLLQVNGTIPSGPEFSSVGMTYYSLLKNMVTTARRFTEQ